MKRRFTLAALVLASAAGAATAGVGLAGDISIETAPFMSLVSRADVRADVVAHRDEIVAMHAEDSGSSRQKFTSTLSRSDVVADYIAHRAEVAAFNSEDSGSALLAASPRATAAMRLAVR